MPLHPFDNGELMVRDEVLAGFPRTTQEVKRHNAEYYAMITHADQTIGRVLSALEASGQLENTIIVLAGDNGLAIGRHGLFGKQNMYDHSVHVPLVMAGPGVPRNQTRDAFCYLLDIYPTLCDLVDAPIPETVEGKSLQPVMENPNHIITKHSLLPTVICSVLFRIRTTSLSNMSSMAIRQRSFSTAITIPWKCIIWRMILSMQRT